MFDNFCPASTPRIKSLIGPSTANTQHAQCHRNDSSMTSSSRWQMRLTMLLISLSGALAQDSICSRAPQLQILDKSISEYRCETDETIHALNCSHQAIPALPRTSDPGLRHSVGLEVLDFSHNEIMCLPQINNTRSTCSIQDCHAGCLLDLRLQYNKISFIHDEAFVNLTCLQSLDLSHNRITNVTLKKSQFSRLSHLRHLNLHHNPLHTLPDNVLTFSSLGHLHTLNLSFCQLKQIGEIALDDFFEMEILDLSNNKLRELADITFKGLVSLRILDLRWNKLEVIVKDTFGDLRNLQELRLEHNRLHVLSEEAFHKHAAFPALRLSYNRFTDIPFYALSTLKKLRSLDVCHNPIMTLKPGHVKTSVQELRLDHLENLTSVADGAFSAFPHLSRFSLRFAHRLTTISEKAFQNSGGELSEVLLDHNGLTYLPENLLPWQGLDLLTWHGNRWRCDCLLGWAAGRSLGNTSIRCYDPLKLKGQDLHTLQSTELACPKELVGLKVIIALSLNSVAMVTMVLVVWPCRRRLPCRCLRGTSGRYMTVYTKEKNVIDDAEEADSGCGEGEVDDLDLGNGEGARSDGGRVMILLNSFRSGYKRLKTKNSESSQDLTLASDV